VLVRERGEPDVEHARLVELPGKQPLEGLLKLSV
jgi:hypothetical protein